MKTAIILILLLLVGCAQTTVAPDDDIITIGLMAPLQGGYAEFGQNIVTSVTMASEDYDFNLVVEDEGDCESKVESMNALNKLIAIDQVDVIIGPLCLANFMAALPVAYEADIPMLGYGVSQFHINDHGNLPEYDDIAVGAFPSPDSLWIELAEYAFNKSDHMIIISVIDPASENNVNAFIDHYAELGGIVDKHETVGLNEIDFRTFLLGVDSDTKLIWPHLPNPDRVKFYKQKEELGLLENVEILGDIWVEIDPSDYIEGLGIDYLDGTVSSNFVVTTDPVFIARFKEQSGRDITLAADIAYDLAARGSQILDECTTTKCVATTFRETSFEGVSGTLAFDENAERKGETIIRTYRDGVFE
jgi:ABC-type branched-subunit amino acid transport system substrate-binding protein